MKNQIQSNRRQVRLKRKRLSDKLSSVRNSSSPDNQTSTTLSSTTTPIPEGNPIGYITGPMLNVKIAPGEYEIDFGSTSQGMNGTCAVIATLPKNVRYQVDANNNFTFQFYDRLTGLPDSITVTGERGLRDSRNAGGILERAYGIWIGKKGYYDASKTPWEEIITGNKMLEVIRDITGRVAYEGYGVPPIKTLEQANEGKTVILSNWGSSTDYIILNHAYRVVGISSDPDPLVTFWNPMGRDGGKLTSGNPQDGMIQLNYSQLPSQFPQAYWGAG